MGDLYNFKQTAGDDRATVKRESPLFPRDFVPLLRNVVGYDLLDLDLEYYSFSEYFDLKSCIVTKCFGETSFALLSDYVKMKNSMR